MENKFASILGDRLLTISKVSIETGISRSTLTNLYYRRSKSFKLETLIKICDYLNINLSELIEYRPRKEQT